MLPQAIFFDMDDTLLVETTSGEIAWEKACHLSIKTTKPYKTADLLAQIHVVRTWYWRDPERHRIGRLDLQKARVYIVRTALKNLDCTDEAAAAEIATNYSNILGAGLALFPDAESTLRQLADKRVKLVMLTNGAGESQRAKIKRFGLEKYFPTCLIEGELGYGKPDRRVFEMGIAQSGVKPEQVWMVGDDLARDITGAQQIGIFSIWHDFNKSGLPEDSKVKPDRIINNLSELLKE